MLSLRKSSSLWACHSTDCDYIIPIKLPVNILETMKERITIRDNLLKLHPINQIIRIKENHPVAHKVESNAGRINSFVFQTCRSSRIGNGQYFRDKGSYLTVNFLPPPGRVISQVLLGVARFTTSLTGRATPAALVAVQLARSRL